MTNRITNKIFNHAAIMDEEAREDHVNRENARIFDAMLFEINFWANEEMPLRIVNPIEPHENEFIYVPAGRRELPPGPLELIQITFNPETRYDGFTPMLPKRMAG